MIEIFYKFSFPMVKNKAVNKLLSAWNMFMRACMRYMYPFYCKKNPIINGITDREYDENIVISLTSFPARMDSIGLTIESLLRQSMKPNRIILWLTKEENPTLEIPNQIKKYIDLGLEVRFSDENLKPHNKSFHTARICSDSIIITADDDILYSEKFVERLYKSYQNSDKKTVICELAHEITIGENKKPRDYDKWNIESIGKTGPSDLLLAKGVGGVLYPRGFFRDIYFDIETIKETCLMADDLWLKFVEIMRGYKVKKTKAYARNVYTVGKSSQKISLSSINNGEKRNNKYLKLLTEKFDKIEWDKLK